MNEKDPTVGQLTPSEHEALRWVASTPVPTPSEETRERARNAFLTGSVTQARRPLTVRSLVMLAAAASIVALVWLGSRPAGSWEVLAANGAQIEDGDVLSGGSSFRFGTALTSPSGDLDLRLGGLRLQVPAGSRVGLPPAPGRWFGKSRVLRVEAGEIFATSGGGSLGFDLIVETPETRTRILGTTFAVRCNALGTCVCLYSGSIEVASLDGSEIVAVPQNMRVQFYEDHRAPTVEPLSRGERETLEQLHSSGLTSF